MGRTTRKGAHGRRQILGTLLVAWTFVTGLLAVLASAYYYRYGDVWWYIVFLLPAFVIGVAILIMMAFVHLGTPRFQEQEDWRAPRRPLLGKR